MLINELKKEIEKYDKKELKCIIVELYKKIPKNKKEDYNIDDYIKNIKNNAKKTINFDKLKDEIVYFLECVDNEYYVVPNRIVSKKERSSWRFKVKKYYKELSNIIPNSTDGVLATFLLIELFKRLSIGSNRLLFITCDTFGALGVSQSKYYDNIVKRILYNNYTEEKIIECIKLLEIVKDPNEISYDMFSVFISNLNNTVIKEKAINLLKEKVKELKIKLGNEKDNISIYYLNDDINDYVECILELYLIMGEYEEGINYFNKKYIEDDKEVKEYVLLCKLDFYKLDEEWIKEYEKNISKIKYRKIINDRYNELKKK